MKRCSLRIMLISSVLLLLGMFGLARAEVSPEVTSLNLTPEQWVGHSFLFLDLPADKRAEGYEIFTEEQAKQGFQGDRSVRLPYAAHVGKQVTVTQVVPFSTDDNKYPGDSRFDYVVHMKENATGQNLVGRTMSGQLEGLVLEDDLLKARQQFLGKTVYSKRRILQGAYEPYMSTVPPVVMCQIGGAAQVVDVYTGIQSVEPIWLIVMVNGQKAILPIAYSWTNMPANVRTQSPPWQNELFTEDPRVQLGWPNALWKQIEDGIVQEGMTKEQILLSWGPPAFIENTGSPYRDIWHYGTTVLKFSGNILDAQETTELKNAVIP